MVTFLQLECMYMVHIVHTKIRLLQLHVKKQLLERDIKKGGVKVTFYLPVAETAEGIAQFVPEVYGVETAVVPLQ